MAQLSPALIVRRLDDGEEIDRISVEGCTDRQIDRIEAGVLRQMDAERFFLDRTAVEDR